MMLQKTNVVKGFSDDSPEKTRIEKEGVIGIFWGKKEGKKGNP